MPDIDRDQIILDEYADEMIRQEMLDRLALISVKRIEQEITKHLLWKMYPMEVHFVGSSTEGIPQSAWSDEDRMLCNTEFPIVLWTPKKGRRNYVMGEPNVNKPVYLRLKVVDKMYLDEKIRNTFDNDGYLKTNDFITNSMKSIHPYLDIKVRQGPSMVKKLNEEFVDILTETIDTVYFLKCQSWPDFTSNFFTRRKLNNWPSQKLLDKVKGLECHVVPVGYPGSESYDTEWRLSFSVAERELVTEMYEPYANCMFAMKLIKKKYIIFSDSEKPTPFCSYFIKTACLWMCETFPHTDYSVMDLIKRVLDWLIDCYQHKHLPHYFISQHNLIGHLSMETCDNVRKQLIKVRTLDLSTKVLLSINATNSTFVKLVNNMRAMNYPGTTGFITKALHDLRTKSGLIHNILMKKWAGYDFYLYLENIKSFGQEDILLALRFPENSILPIVEHVNELLPKGYGEMFRTRLYRFLGDAYTNLLIPLQNKGHDELLNVYQDRHLYYYGLGAKMVFPDNYCDHGIGGQILIVQFHYLMGNYNELKTMCESIVSRVEETKTYKNTRLASIELRVEKPLGVNAWATDELMLHLVKRTKILSVYLHPVALVLYIQARVLLTEGDTENAVHVVKNMKAYMDEENSNTTEMFITIIESLAGLLGAMKRIVRNNRN